MNRLLIAISAILVSSNCVNGQYFEWPNAFNNFQQQQQFQYNYQPRAQYQPVQYQQQQQQPQQQFYQQQQQPQQQLYQSQPQYQPPQGPSPIYSQTVIIPEAPPPPPEAYQTQQYQPAQSAPVLVSPAQYNVQQPAIAAAPSSSSSSSSSQQLQRFEQRARSVPNFEVNNKLFREQPMAFQQNQEKPIENPEYHPDQVIVDRHRTAYFEDTQRTRPQQPKQRVQGGNVNAVFHSSSANIPSRASPQPPPPQPGRSVAVIASPSQQQQRPPQVKPQPQRPPVAPQPPRRVVRPTVRPASASRPSSSVVTRPRPPVVRTRPASNAVVPQTPTRQLAKVATAAPPPVSHLVAAKPKTASEKFLQCCKARNVDKSCERICSFDVLSKKTLTGMFLGTDPCPQKHGADLMQCAADNDDHTQCCIDYEVDRTSAGKKCLGFCNMKPGVTFQADVSMLPCWAVLNDIKKCFKENLDQQLAAAAVIA